MSETLVTIAIPTYNRADKYLKQTLESALNQTYENLEILVSDNCSTDNTEELVLSYSDSRLRYFKQKENLGPRGNSNFLLSKAKGKYFHMFHDDDRIDHDFIETCMKKAEDREDAGIIMSGSRVIDEKGNVLRENKNNSEGLTTGELIISWYRNEMNIFLCCTLFNTNVLRKIGGFQAKYNHYADVAANLKCSKLAGRIDVADIKASFRKHAGSITNSTEVNTWCRDAYTLLDLAYSLAPSKKKAIRKYGLKQSAKNVYMYGSKRESRKDRLKGFWIVYKNFGYRYTPPFKYCNELLPFSGYLLHPFYGSSKLIREGLSKVNKISTKAFSESG